MARRTYALSEPSCPDGCGGGGRGRGDFAGDDVGGANSRELMLIVARSAFHLAQGERFCGDGGASRDDTLSLQLTMIHPTINSAESRRADGGGEVFRWDATAGCHVPAESASMAGRRLWWERRGRASDTPCGAKLADGTAIWEKFVTQSVGDARHEIREASDAERESRRRVAGAGQFRARCFAFYRARRGWSASMSGWN